MPYYESEQLFRALSDARERSADAPEAIRPGVEELLTIALLAGIVPERVDRLADVTIDCAPDVRPVVNALIASLVSRPRAQHPRIVATTRALIESGGDKHVAGGDGDADAFAAFTWESFKE